MNKIKDAFVIVRVPQELKDELLAKAKKKGITISELFRDMIEKDTKK
jgi:hypothetical protein